MRKKTRRSEQIPRDKWVDPLKPTKTAAGKRVVNLRRTLMDTRSTKESDRPITGVVIDSDAPFLIRHLSWTLDGRVSDTYLTADDLVQ